MQKWQKVRLPVWFLYELYRNYTYEYTYLQNIFVLIINIRQILRIRSIRGKNKVESAKLLPPIFHSIKKYLYRNCDVLALYKFKRKILFIGNLSHKFFVH